MGVHSSAGLRPGLVQGVYPERADQAPRALDQAGHVLRGYVRRLTRNSQSPGARFLGQMEAYAEQVAQLEDREILSHADALRRDFSQHGLEDHLVAHAFALIREVAERRLGLRHYDVQILGGWMILQGMVAEMATGEGKTLTAALPACTAALAGIPVQVITVNEYLVERDVALLAALYEALGIRVACATASMSVAERQKAYRANVTYCTNKQVAFDYLRDRISLSRKKGRLHLQLEGVKESSESSAGLILPGLCFGIVDEADSVLVDEARTPLIISARASGETVEAYRTALEIAALLEQATDYVVDARERQILLTEQGRGRVAACAGELQGIWRASRPREDLVVKALSAHHLFIRDVHYVVTDGQVQIVDEFTGRVMPDRSWEHGLHQMIELLEGCELTEQNETLARISYQRFFRRYLRLGGMTGTGREVTSELWSVYRLDVASVPTHRAVQRGDLGTAVYRTAAQKWDAVGARVKALHATGRPVLVGTRSVECSEHLAALLAELHVPCRVLNAHQDDHEAAIVAEAGAAGAVTVATNMAGRGTDIHLGPGVSGSGGLHVILTERHEARRIDRQLAGRCARQGDPGSIEELISLEDELLQRYERAVTRRLLDLLLDRFPPILAQGCAKIIISAAQRRAERNSARVRRELLKMDDQLGRMLAFSGRQE